MARQKAQLIDLPNVHFTNESHTSPLKKGFADIAYDVNAFTSDVLNDTQELQKEVRGVVSRVKKGGIAIFSYHALGGQRLSLELSREHLTPIISEFLDRTSNATGDYEMSSD